MAITIIIIFISKQSPKRRLLISFLLHILKIYDTNTITIYIALQFSKFPFTFSIFSIILYIIQIIYENGG